MDISTQENDKFQYFKTAISSIELPKKFTFPFYYEPHPLCLFAAKELQSYLQTQTEWKHNFGLDKNEKGLPLGKMFGVLVVQNKQKELGYLAAVSGKLANSNSHTKFVPPIFNMLTNDSFFLKGETELNAINKQIERLENDAKLKELYAFLKQEYLISNKDLSEKKELAKTAKRIRNKKRQRAHSQLNETEYKNLEKQLSTESIESRYFLNNVNRYWNYRLNETKEKIAVYNNEISQLKEARKLKSAALQQQLFAQYRFLNQYGEAADLSDIFSKQQPPAGAGECAAPKLLQYAFTHNLKALGLAEFWWGISPNTEIRKHQYFYPACQGKCKPILSHMLKGIEMDSNPMLNNPAIGKELEIIFEDDTLLVINKPPEFLSVPGIHIHDSVYSRIKQQYPEATGPLIVHRLDMSTSGILLLTKTKEANKILQSQFIERTIKKRYIAVLNGILTEPKGEISLPLRVDVDDRPRQLVCYKHGKAATTYWKKIEVKDGKTRVYLYPHTGRTHQLRVHTAHSLGLNTPIVGDDLYGTKANRLYLHADFLEFTHPITKKKISFYKDPEF